MPAELLVLIGRGTALVDLSPDDLTHLGIAAKAGGRFDCHFTGPEGPYTAYLRIVKVQGRHAAFQVETQPSNWPAPKLP